MSSRLVITGAGGFIGSYLTSRLDDEGHTIVKARYIDGNLVLSSPLQRGEHIILLNLAAATSDADNFSIAYGQSQVLETLVDIGGYNMHFSIFEGEGTPILFESGAGDDGTVWKAIAKDVHDVTGTTVIYYDRSGFGTSELNPNYKKQ